jgi:hypothetical protein
MRYFRYDAFYRAVFGPQPCRAGAQSFAAAESIQNIVDHHLVGMDRGNIQTYVLATRITEEVQLSLIRPKNDTVCGDGMHRDRSRRNKIQAGFVGVARAI